MALLFMLVTGALLCLDFQRWRVYVPSVGLVAIIAVVVARSSGITRTVLSIALACLMGFHVYRALDAQAETRESTALLESLRNSLESAISDLKPEQGLGIVASPAKLGSAGVWQLGRAALVRRAEANVRSEDNRRDGSIRNCYVQSWTAIDVFSLDRSTAFQGLTVQARQPHQFLVSVPQQSDIFLLPGVHDLSWREIAMKVGDSVTTSDFVLIVREVRSNQIKSIELTVRDTAAVLYSFDGRSQFTPVNAHR
jgi:hypothetical protein